MQRFNLNKSQRLRSTIEFERIFAVRCTAHASSMGLFIAPNDCGYARLGIRIGKRYGGAVQRVRARRRMREAFRMNQHTLGPLDYIVVLRSADLTTGELSALLLKLAKKAHRKMSGGLTLKKGTEEG